MTAFLHRFLAALIVGVVPFGTARGDSINIPIGAPIKIILAGDSTTSQRTGWGGAFCDLHVFDVVSCMVMGRGGRSTKTYRGEGTWDLVLQEVRVNGYFTRLVLIELGHNDKNADSAIGTDIKSEFPGNLSRFIEEVRSAGGLPILVTPLAARHFAKGRLDDTLAPWAEKVRTVAKATNTVMIDLNHASSSLYQKLGALNSLQFEINRPTAAELKAAQEGTTLPGRLASSLPPSNAAPADDPRRHYSADYIHLNEFGAKQVSSLVAQGLLTAIPALKTHVIP